MNFANDKSTIKTPCIFLYLTVITFFLVSISILYSNSTLAGTDEEVNDPRSLELKWKERIEIDSGDAYRGPWRMNQSQFHFVDDPTVALNDRGDIAVAWGDLKEQDIFLKIFTMEGERKTEPVNISKSPEIFSWLPRVTISEDGKRIFILWQEIVFSGGSHGGEIFFSYSEDHGKTFTEPVNLSETTAGAGKGRITRNFWHNGSLDIEISGDNVYTIWTEYEGKLWFRKSEDGGKTFSAGLQLAGSDSIPARGPSLAVSDDNIFVAWTVGEDRAANIHFAHSDDNGSSFSDPVKVHESKGHSDAPKLAVGKSGTIHLVFSDSPDGPLQKYRILYTRSENRGKSFKQPAVISKPHNKRFASINFPHLSIDADENLYILWELFPEVRSRPQGLGIAFMKKGNSSPVYHGIVPESIDSEGGLNGSQQGLLMKKLAVNDSGDIAVVNSTFRNNQSSHIWLYRARLNTK